MDYIVYTDIQYYPHILEEIFFALTNPYVTLVYNLCCVCGTSCVFVTSPHVSEKGKGQVSHL